MESKSVNTQVPDMESFYKALEQNPKLLEEAFEVMLVLVSSDPISTKNLAELIRNDYPAFFKQLMDLVPKNKDLDGKSSCCGGH